VRGGGMIMNEMRIYPMEWILSVPSRDTVSQPLIPKNKTLRNKNTKQSKATFIYLSVLSTTPSIPSTFNIQYQHQHRLKW
jgi:hypothetical protein